MNGTHPVARGLLLTLVAAGLVVAMAWPWGGEAMLAGGLGALAAGLSFALMEVGTPGDRVLPAAEADAARPQASSVEPQAPPVERLAQALFADERLYDQAYWRAQPRVHCLVVGDGALAAACIEEAVFAGIAGELDRPRVTILCRDPERFRSSLAFTMPELAASATVVVAEVALRLPTSFERAVAEADAASPLTAVVLCAETQEDRERHGAWLDTIARRRDRALAPVFALSPASPASPDAGPTGRQADMGARVVVRSGLPARAQAEEATAQRMHEAYLAAFGDRAGSNVAWAELPETFRVANRRAVRHLAQKLWTAGLTFAGTASDPGAVAPAFFASVVQPTAANPGEDAALRRLARLEHERWCADRRLQGWTRAPDYDAARRHHPSLVPFDDPSFTAAEIAKDVEQVRFLLARVAFAAPGGVASPLVLGVIAREGESMGDATGVDPAAALDLIGLGAGRPTIVLSALLSDWECACAERLVGALRDGGRLFRLLVPTLARNGVRALSADGARRLDALLGRAETTIVPIHAEASPKQEGWADPEAQTAERAALAAYIGARAGSIVCEPQHAAA